MFDILLSLDSVRAQFTAPYLYATDTYIFIPSSLHLITFLVHFWVVMPPNRVLDPRLELTQPWSYGIFENIYTNVIHMYLLTIIISIISLSIC